MTGARTAPRRPLTRAIYVLAAILAAASVWYVQAPPRSPETYHDRAVETVEALRSQVQTARIWVRSAEDGETTREAATVGLREAEEDARKAASTFEGYDPPEGTEDLRTRVSALATETTGALARLRIATAQEDWDELTRLAEPLPGLADRLAELDKAAKP
ncbi:MAG: hypothetical protein M3340_09460 [Actinomycetota bacterium]|nr:hypothetical protein [Actinomycetota bacterium]